MEQIKISLYRVRQESKTHRISYNRQGYSKASMKVMMRSCKCLAICIRQNNLFIIIFSI
jgi:hypothetical protein